MFQKIFYSTTSKQEDLVAKLTAKCFNQTSVKRNVITDLIKTPLKVRIDSHYQQLLSLFCINHQTFLDSKIHTI
jgi:hypothetical protein